MLDRQDEPQNLDYSALANVRYKNFTDGFTTELENLKTWYTENPHFAGISTVKKIHKLYKKVTDARFKADYYSLTRVTIDEIILEDLQTMNATLRSPTIENLASLYARCEKSRSFLSLETKLNISDTITFLYIGIFITLMATSYKLPILPLALLQIGNAVWKSSVTLTDESCRPWQLEASRNRMFQLVKKMDTDHDLIGLPPNNTNEIEPLIDVNSEYYLNTKSIYDSYTEQLDAELQKLKNWSDQSPNFVGIELVKEIYKKNTLAINARNKLNHYTPSGFTNDKSILEDLKAVNAALIAPTQANVSALLARSLKPTLGMYADTKEKMTFLGAALTGVLLLSSTIAAFAFRPAGIPLWIASVATLICTFAAAIYNNRAPAHSPSRNRMFTLSKTLDNEASSRAPEVNHALATRPLPV